VAVKGLEPQSHIVSVMSDVDAVHAAPERLADLGELPDDRELIRAEDRVLLVVENDENFARFLVDLAHENGFKAVVATKGADAMSLVRSVPHVDAITLDIQLPVMDGWRVLSRLKGDLATRHIPIYVITTEEDTARAFPLGAIGALQKPIKTREALDQAFGEIRRTLDRTERQLLVVCPDGGQRARILGALGDGQLRHREIPALRDGLAALGDGAFDCVVLDVGESATIDLELLEEIVRQCSGRRIPVVLSYSEVGLSEADREKLDRLCRAVGVKPVRSLDRLVDQTLLYLHRPIGALTEEQRARIERLYATDEVLAGKKVLIVDDDIRNIFAITSVLERQHMNVISAETGKEAIAKLQGTPGIDAVLMDVMMPDMDGYDTMRAIRKTGRHDDLPIIAVTAKAMKGDREKTLQAGAWDYLAKPVDTDQMLSVLRSWLYR
jgi:CheY-like chemotaxis protein